MKLLFLIDPLAVTSTRKHAQKKVRVVKQKISGQLTSGWVLSGIVLPSTFHLLAEYFVAVAASAAPTIIVTSTVLILIQEHRLRTCETTILVLCRCHHLLLIELLRHLSWLLYLTASDYLCACRRYSLIISIWLLLLLIASTRWHQFNPILLLTARSAIELLSVRLETSMLSRLMLRMLLLMHFILSNDVLSLGRTTILRSCISWVLLMSVGGRSVGLNDVVVLDSSEV